MINDLDHEYRHAPILFNSHGLCQIPRLVHIGAFLQCRMIRQQLQRNGVEYRRQRTIMATRQFDDVDKLRLVDVDIAIRNHI